MTASTNTLPEPVDRRNDDFWVNSRREVLGILKDIIDRRALVTLYYRGVSGFMVTNLLAVNPEFEELVFDRAQDDAANRAIAASAELTFVTFVDHIKTQFSARQAGTTMFENLPALRARLPSSVLRLQRRNHFRVPAPKASPLVCEVPIEGDEPARFLVADLSVGGAAILAGPETAAFEPGMVFHGCRIDLPDHGVITTSIELRSQTQLAHAGSKKPMRYGCRFVDLAGTAENLIQRYINDLERARRALT